MRPKKNLGQCFLINPRAAERIAGLLELTPQDQVLEIGGGRGDLTRFLVESGAKVYSVEIDHDLAVTLQERFGSTDRFVLIEHDILELDPHTVSSPGRVFKLAGNIPYHLSSRIIEWIISNRALFRDCVLTVQKELGERVAAAPGSKAFGSLTVFVQTFYAARRVFDLKPGSFFPAPKVFSSVIRLERLTQSLVTDEEWPRLRRLTSACFRWRRKQMIRILREEYRLGPPVIESLLEKLAIVPSTRPEQLSVNQFVALSRELTCVDLESS